MATTAPRPGPIAQYARLDAAARHALNLPAHDPGSAPDDLARALAHTVAYLMERYLRACKDAGLDGGPHLIRALAAEHEVVNNVALDVAPAIAPASTTHPLPDKCLGESSSANDPVKENAVPPVTAGARATVVKDVAPALARASEARPPHAKSPPVAAPVEEAVPQVTAPISVSGAQGARAAVVNDVAPALALASEAHPLRAKYLRVSPPPTDPVGKAVLDVAPPLTAPVSRSDAQGANDSLTSSVHTSNPTDTAPGVRSTSPPRAEHEEGSATAPSVDELGPFIRDILRDAGIVGTKIVRRRLAALGLPGVTLEWTQEHKKALNWLIFKEADALEAEAHKRMTKLLPFVRGILRNGPIVGTKGVRRRLAKLKLPGVTLDWTLTHKDALDALISRESDALAAEAAGKTLAPREDEPAAVDPAPVPTVDVATPLAPAPPVTRLSPPLVYASADVPLSEPMSTVPVSSSHPRETTRGRPPAAAASVPAPAESRNLSHPADSLAGMGVSAVAGRAVAEPPAASTPLAEPTSAQLPSPPTNPTTSERAHEAIPVLQSSPPSTSAGKGSKPKGRPRKTVKDPVQPENTARKYRRKEKSERAAKEAQAVAEGSGAAGTPGPPSPVVDATAKRTPAPFPMRPPVAKPPLFPLPPSAESRKSKTSPAGPAGPSPVMQEAGSQEPVPPPAPFVLPKLRIPARALEKRKRTATPEDSDEDEFEASFMRKRRITSASG